MSAPGQHPTSAPGPGDRPRPANNPPNMSAPSPSPAGLNPGGTSGTRDRPRPATNPPSMRSNITTPYPMVTHNTTQSQDNHAPQGAHANWFGTSTHIGSGESAQFQNHQLGFAPPATHQFNFSPGSYATFPTQQYQNIARLVTHQPSHNTPAEIAEERAFQQDYDHFINPDGILDNDGHSDSKKSAGQPTTGVNDLQNPNSHSGIPHQPSNLMHNTAQPQPFSHQGQPPTPRSGNLYWNGLLTAYEQQLAISTLNSHYAPSPHQSHKQQPTHYNTIFDPRVSNQHNASSDAACPRGFEHAPANGTYDMSGGNTQSSQESMPQTQTISSNGNKRDSSKISDGNAASSVEDPKKKRKTATKKENIDWHPTDFGSSYKGMTAEVAEERLTKRIPMILAEEDDLETVMDNEADWVRRLMSAFGKQYSAAPVVEDFKKLIHVFKPWQDEHYSKVMRVIDGDNIGNLVEAAATDVYSKIISSHKTKTLEPHGATFKYDRTLTCSKRLIACVEAIEKLTLVREDVIHNVRIAEFISNPAGLMKRKESNKVWNERRKIEVAEKKKLEEQIRELKKKLEELNLNSEDQDDSSDPQAENDGSASSEVPAQALTEPQDDAM